MSVDDYLDNEIGGYVSLPYSNGPIHIVKIKKLSHPLTGRKVLEQRSTLCGFNPNPYDIREIRGENERICKNCLKSLRKRQIQELQDEC